MVLVEGTDLMSTGRYMRAAIIVPTEGNCESDPDIGYI